jgi:hypothetical protein
VEEVTQPHFVDLLAGFDRSEPRPPRAQFETVTGPTCDFDTDDLSAIADHFVISTTGFPPDDFTDLTLPVVDPDGDLTENALQTAHGGAHSVDAVDDETRAGVEERLETPSRAEFDSELGEGGEHVLTTGTGASHPRHTTPAQSCPSVSSRSATFDTSTVDSTAVRTDSRSRMSSGPASYARTYSARLCSSRAWRMAK